jgi:hypothetical protein
MTICVSNVCQHVEFLYIGMLDIAFLTIHVDAGAMAFTRRKYLPPRLAAETCRQDILARRAKTHNTT